MYRKLSTSPTGSFCSTRAGSFRKEHPMNCCSPPLANTPGTFLKNSVFNWKPAGSDQPIIPLLSGHSITLRTDKADGPIRKPLAIHASAIGQITAANGAAYRADFYLPAYRHPYRTPAGYLYPPP